MTDSSNTACGYTHPSDLARAMWRFSAEVPIAYHGNYPDAPLRWTREDAEQDACKELHGVVAA